MAKTIVFELDPRTREVTYETKGFAGNACRAAIAPFLKAGNLRETASEPTAEAATAARPATAVEQRVDGG